jgi:hypothetical protein
MQEQSLTISKPINEDKEAPMEVDEINQENKKTPLIDEDTQGSDYNVKVYLDEKSKLSLL